MLTVPCLAEKSRNPKIREQSNSSQSIYDKYELLGEVTI